MWQIGVMIFGIGIIIAQIIDLKRKWLHLTSIKRRRDIVVLVWYSLSIAFVGLTRIPRLEFWANIAAVLMVCFGIYSFKLRLRAKQDQDFPGPSAMPPD